MADRTILMSENKAEEDWKPSLLTRILRHLSGTVKPKFGKVKYTPTKTDSFKAGYLKGPRTTRQGHKTRYFGAEFERKF